MKVRQIATALEAIAPPRLAASWDNVGLLIGESRAEARKVLLCIDLTADVLGEAARSGAEMVVAYHPVIFRPISRLTAGDSPAAYAAARAGLAVYCPHTALDAAPGGTNDVLADVLRLKNRRPLEPFAAQGERKIVVFVPPDDLSRVAEAAFGAGAGRIGNYFDCAFFCHGVGAFCGGEGARPTIGHAGRHEVAEELRLEVVAPANKAAAVCDAIRTAHSYEQPAVDVYPLEEYPEGCGLGRVGWLDRPATVETLIGRIKRATGLKKLLVARATGAARHAHANGSVGTCLQTAGRQVAPGDGGGEACPRKRQRGHGTRRRANLVTMAACCAGSCGSLYQPALAAGATFYLTGEMRHHDALAATAAGMTVVCLGHSNSERLILPVLARRLRETCRGLIVAVSKLDRDPFQIT